MEDLQASYKDDDNGDGSTDNNDSHNSDILSSDPTLPSTAVGGDAPAAGATTTSSATPDTEADALIDVKDEPNPSEDEITDKNRPNSPNFAPISGDDDEEEEEYEEPSPKKQKHLSSVTPTAEKTSDAGVAVASTPALHPTTKRMNASATATDTDATVAKKSKKKNSSSVWTKPTSRKGKKKNKNNNNANNRTEETVAITPIFRFPDKTDDTPDMKICLSKVYKAEKVELSDDRLSAGSTKGYRMVRATRGVMDGAWYFEIRVVKLGETGHTRLGWSTDKGDLQAPAGYDANSFGYRDIDGSKIHKALREKYGEEGYGEGDVIGFYINLPDGSLYAPKPPKLVWYKGQRYACAPDEKEDPPKVVPGSEISFFKNGICQGVAFRDLCGGRYYPAASMYTLPNQPNCVVKFNFGPDFDMFPEDFGDHSIPRPMIEVPYHGYDGKVENANGNHPQAFQSVRMCPTLRVVKGQANGVAETA